MHRGALAAMGRLPLLDVAAVLPRATSVVVLEEVNSHTNLGAIFRCAAGLGMDAVLLSPTCADPLYRRSVRVSMGEVFAVPYARFGSWPAGLAELTAAGFTVLALTPDPAATSIDDLVISDGEKLALVMGAEGPGLSPAALIAASQRVRIPMANGVDSLNVAAAAAVACYAVQRARPAANSLKLSRRFGGGSNRRLKGAAHGVGVWARLLYFGSCATHLEPGAKSISGRLCGGAILAP